MATRLSATTTSRALPAHTARAASRWWKAAPSRGPTSTRRVRAGVSDSTSAARGRVTCCDSFATARRPSLRYALSTAADGGPMSENRPVREEPRLEDHKVYALLAIPVFLVTLFIIGLIATLGTSPRP